MIIYKIRKFGEENDAEFMSDVIKLREQCCDETLGESCDDKLGIFDVPENFYCDENSLTWIAMGNLLLKIFTYLKENDLV